MADQKDTYGFEQKTTGGMIDPFKPVLVGEDCDAARRPELFDPERLRLPLDEAMITSIITNGVIDPVAIKKFTGDDFVYIADGRQRIRNAREAIKRTGRMILVPCFIVKGDAVATFVTGNRFRRNNTVLSDARTADHLSSCGTDDVQIAQLFGVGLSVIRTLWWLLVRNCSPALQKAVEEKGVTATAAVEISKLPPEQQAEALVRAIEDGGGQVVLDNIRAARRAAKEGKPASEAPRRLSAPKIKLFIASLEPTADDEVLDPDCDDYLKVAHSVLRAVGGEGVAALEEYPVLKAKLAALMQPAAPPVVASEVNS